MTPIRKHLSTSVSDSILFQILVIGVSVGNALTCPPANYLIGDECCPKCPPGSRVKRDCTEFRGTSCQPCESGTYMDIPTGRKQCLSCSLCDPGSGLKVKSSCTTTVDAVCEPLEGFFCVQQTGDHCASAQRHTQCEPGQYIQQKGTALTDTVCSDCSTGTFSDGTFTACRAHTQCEAPNLVVVVAGTTSSDAQCRESSKITILIIATVLCVVLVVVSGVAFYLWKSRKCRRGKHTNAARLREDNQPGEENKMIAA